MEELIEILINLLASFFQNKPARPPQQLNAPPRQAPGTPQVLQVRKPAPRRAARRPAPPGIAMADPILTTVSKAAPAAVPTIVPMARSIVANTGIAAPGSTPSQSAASIRKWLKPDTLKHQFLLTEIFQPPLALRKEIYPRMNTNSHE